MDLDGRLRLLGQRINDPNRASVPGDAMETLEDARRVLSAAVRVLEANQLLRIAGLTAPPKLSLELEHLADALTAATTKHPRSTSHSA